MGSPTSEGLLLVDKPAGMTSHDVVGAARRALGERRIGHTGTLDPFATGLLVLLVGRATRLIQYVEGEPKVYEATIRFGVETTTDDLTGEPARTAPLPEPAAVDAGIAALTGPLDQLPPAYSAKQVGGVRAYAAARRGQALELRPARVDVHGWEVRARREDELDVTITCGTGTYIRALARDLGRLAGSAAHLTALRRVRSGPFTVAEALPMDRLDDARAALRPALDALSLPVDQLDEASLSRVARGLQVPAEAPGPRAALVDGARRLVAVAERAGGNWQPKVVLHDA